MLIGSSMVDQLGFKCLKDLFHSLLITNIGHDDLNIFSTEFLSTFQFKEE